MPSATCPGCHATFAVPENAVGRRVLCLKCGAGFVAGGPAEVPVSVAGPPAKPQRPPARLLPSRTLKPGGVRDAIAATAWVMFGVSLPFTVWIGFYGDLLTAMRHGLLVVGGYCFCRMLDRMTRR